MKYIYTCIYWIELNQNPQSVHSAAIFVTSLDSYFQRPRPRLIYLNGEIIKSQKLLDILKILILNQQQNLT